MNILLTGATGFIGSYLVPILIENGYNVRLLTRNKTTAYEKFGKSCDYFEGDICDSSTILNCCSNIDIVVHLAAISGNDKKNKKNIKKYFRINYYGTQNILNEAKRSNIKKFIYVSSSAALGVVNAEIIDEETKSKAKIPYDYSKYMTEKYIINEFESSFDIVILRPTKIYGEGENSSSLLNQIKLAKRGFSINIGLKTKKFTNLYVLDFVNSIVSAIHFGKNKNIYFIAADSISTKEFAKICGSEFKTKVRTLYIPKFIAYFIVFFYNVFCKIIRKKSNVTIRNIKSLSTNRVYDCKKAKTDLNYVYTVDMNQGLIKMINWYKSEGKI